MHPSYSWICLELSQSVDFSESYPRWLSTTVDRFWQKEFNSDKYHSVIIIELHSRYTKSIFYFISPDTPTNSSHYIQAHTGPVSSTTIYYHSTHWRLPDLHPPSPLSLTVTSEWVQNPKSDTRAFQSHDHWHRGTCIHSDRHWRRRTHHTLHYNQNVA